MAPSKKTRYFTLFLTILVVWFLFWRSNSRDAVNHDPSGHTIPVDTPTSDTPSSTPKPDVSPNLPASTTAMDASPGVGGIVVTENQSPLGGALVELLNGGESFAFTTETDGRFQFDGVTASAACTLQAKANGYERASLEITVPPEGLTDIVITLTRGCVVQGKVVDSDGRSVPNIIVTAIGQQTIPEERQAEFTRNDYNDYSDAASTLTDQNGSFLLPHLQPGEWLLGAKDAASGRVLADPRCNQALAEIVLVKGEHQYLELVLLGKSKNYAIEGVVRSDQGTPIPGANGVPLVIQIAGEVAKTLDWRPGREYLFCGLEPGTYTLAIYGASGQGYVLRETQVVTATDEETPSSDAMPTAVFSPSG